MIKAIIIDDEKRAANALQLMLSEPGLNVVHHGTAHNAPDGVKLIRQHKPQVVFLDINMPVHSGFDVLKQFDRIDFKVVFVTAHQEFAINAIKHQAFDYLLKPIDPDELEACISRIKQAMNEPDNPHKKPASDTNTLAQKDVHRQLAIPIRDGTVFIHPEEIVRVEGEGSYSVFYTADRQKYVSSRNLKEFEELLPGAFFFRIHKSHLINIKKLRKYLKTDGYYVEMEDGTVLELARRRRDELLQLINALS